MRRKDREIKDRQIIEDLLREEKVCRIGMFDGASPYILPLHYVYTASPDSIYLHSAPKGKKMDILGVHPDVCIEIDRLVKIIPDENPCNASAEYLSLICYGKARLCTEIEEKRKALGLFSEKYLGKSHDFSEREANSVSIVHVSLTEITAKGNPGPSI